jgi:hypothetical protein
MAGVHHERADDPGAFIGPPGSWEQTWEPRRQPDSPNVGGILLWEEGVDVGEVAVIDETEPIGQTERIPDRREQWRDCMSSYVN